MSLNDGSIYDARLRHGLRNARPKPERGAEKKKRTLARAQHKRDRDRHRARMFSLDGGKCRRCHRKVWLMPSKAPTIAHIANCHEFVARSLGGDDLDPLNTITVCGDCHPEVTENRLRIVPLNPQRLMRGDVEFVPCAEVA